MNYQHLFYFMTIATEGGVAKAAAKLRLGQSTLSTQLKQLEDQLGLALFTRARRRLQLTEAGKVALNYAQEVFKLGDEMLDALHDRRQLHRISVQIGALDGVAKGVVADLVEAAQRHQPCGVSVVEGQADELLRALTAHEIDLAILNHQPLGGERLRLTARMAGRSAVAVLGAKAFAHCVKGFPGSLSGRPFVMPGPQSRMRHEVEHAFKLQGIEVDAVIETQDGGLQALLAARGAGMTVFAEESADELVKRYGLRRIGTLEGVHDELWLIRAERRVENPVAKHLFEAFETGPVDGRA